ncbi:MAG: metallophosphoesterase [Erysipelotrichaceae bacterium]|nr:metallophosphoesterase [Erysipelotrichaceae bacterium]
MKKKRKLSVITVLILMALVLWTVWGNVTVGITHYEVTSVRLPESFNGFRIALISDLHNASFGSDNSQLIEKIKKERPDIIAITGDMIDSRRTDVAVAVSLARSLTQIAPCYYVTGNHEARIRPELSQLEEGLLAEGVVILHDMYVTLERDGQIIQIAGLYDPDFTDRDAFIQQDILRTKLHQMDLSDDYRILLSHRPETFEAYVSEEIDLVMSGHAHGGQFRLPFIGGLVAPNQGLFPKYDGGMYVSNNTTMIVSRGIGNSIIPVRFNNRPEIVIIELRSDK